MLENVTTISDIKGNLKQGLTKCLLLKNDKGYTPFELAIDVGSTQMFRLILELYNSIELKNPNSKVLSLAVTTSDNLGDTPLIKALKRDRFDMFELMLKISKDKILKYDEVFCLTDE